MSNPPPARKVFVKSFGCQMNVHDAERMKDVLAGEGYADTSAIEDADLVILNTCHIRERATEKVFSELGKVREVKEARAICCAAPTMARASSTRSSRPRTSSTTWPRRRPTPSARAASAPS